MQTTSQKKQTRLFPMLLCLTVLFIVWQAAFFVIHASVTELLDSLAQTSILSELMHPVVILPIAFYFFVQLCAYSVFIYWIWFIAISTGEFFHLSDRATYGVGIVLWFTACVAVLTLNQYLFPASFFAQTMQALGFATTLTMALMVGATSILILATAIAYLNFFYRQRFRLTGSLLLALALITVGISIYDNYWLTARRQPDLTRTKQRPNIILIGLDSLRPDFIHHVSKRKIHTPNIDAFLQSGMTYTNAYTPLARTFPAWASILTAQYPRQSGARDNLTEPSQALAQDNLARHLRSAGYETIYASDEKRFSNITKEYGFDTLLGPKMGVNDFLLGGLSDFPMSNLLVTSPLGRILLPYQYGNRAAAITYHPDDFLSLTKAGLANRSDKPLFLAIHLCLAHWPFTWAESVERANTILPVRYHHSVEEVDAQLGKLFSLLKENRLLENSLVVLLSDHGTALGLLGDNLPTKTNYRGNPGKLALLPALKLSSSPEYSTAKNDYSISTAYGQGTNVASLTQQHVLLSFKRFGANMLATEDASMVSLLDIAPTILAYLSLPPLQSAQGISLANSLSGIKHVDNKISRALFLESGDSISEIETDHIFIEKVVKREIGIYQVNTKNGLLSIKPLAAASMIKNKQHAVIQGDWLLAHYPQQNKTRLAPSANNQSELVFDNYVLPDYYLLMNLKTRQWTIGLDSRFAQNAPTKKLLQQLQDFNRGEI